ncbi:DUF3105 domain-containing protein [Conexibacter sp. W3-3-2]|uniref:DUF3105 domain-containing protein n=1 Tax=Conexibacter sp. W3-3-2 TaxID=2675227 RepID=UPI0012B9C353|nr:DUF3105 domain-containing protein [Conexibacter sp. W3-3-2]MTD47511.1 DUF3105 domain-containing protein [Conexibacter sp. W3-3-2]
MSSRQEQKEARRREREEGAAAAAAAEARQQRTRQVAGIAVAVIAVGGIATAVILGGAGGGGPKATGSGVAAVAIPAQKTTDLAEAAKLARCELREQLPNEGSDHVQGAVDSYKTNPPTSGPHSVTPAQDGEYSPGNEPEKENTVHTLEHGRIIFHFAPGTSAADQGKLSSLYGEDFSGGNGYHQAVMQNNTRMPFKFAAAAWTNYVGCPGPLDAATIDTLRAFRAKYVDKGPELVP